jgi:hypothetical protein
MIFWRRTISLSTTEEIMENVLSGLGYFVIALFIACAAVALFFTKHFALATIVLALVVAVTVRAIILINRSLFWDETDGQLELPFDEGKN